MDVDVGGGAKIWNKGVFLWIVHWLDMCWGRKKVIMQRNSFVPKREEKWGRTQLRWWDESEEDVTGAEIGELICRHDRICGSSSRKSCCIFNTQANEWVLNSTDSCNKVHTLPISLIKLLLCNICFPHTTHKFYSYSRSSSSRWSCPPKTNYLYWCQTYGSKGSVASLGVASTVGVRIIDNVTSDEATQPCIKDDMKKANYKYSPNKQRANLHSSLLTAKGD